LARACGGTARGNCPNPGDICVPAPPMQNAGPTHGAWTHCVGPNNSGFTMCPGPHYTEQYVFGLSIGKDTRHCVPCSCDPPVGSMCSSQVTVYSDNACLMSLGMVTATLSGDMCVDIPGGPLWSKSATPPVYMPGMCATSGGLTGDAPLEAPTLFCCLPTLN
jgi:hypothetical protein